MKSAKKDNESDAHGDIMTVVRALEEYIPHVASIVSNPSLFRVVHPLTSSWRLPFQSQSSMAHKTELHGIHAEYVMTLFTYGLALATLANQYVARVNTPDRWKHATAYISKSRGVLDFLRRCDSITLMESAPVDLQSSTLSSLSHMLSGAAHMLVLYKCEAEAEEGTQSSFSSSLLLRTAIFAREQFGVASSLLGEPASKRKLVSGMVKDNLEKLGREKSKFSIRDKLKLRKDESPSISPQKSPITGPSSSVLGGVLDALSSWLTRARGLAEGFVFKHMAVQAFDANQIGKAVGCATAGLLQIQDIKVSSKSALVGAVQQLNTNLARLEADYKADNDRLSFEPVPSPTELAQEWPSGREVIPAAKWAPQASLDVDAGLGSGSTGQKYSGQGSYY